MAAADYGPTPPRLIPLPDGSEYPTSPDAGTLKTMTSETMTCAVFVDVLAHKMARTVIKPDRCLEIEVYVEAYDPANGRLASGKATLQVARLGAAAPTIVGTPVMMTFTPNAAPWTSVNVLADLVVDGVDGIVVQVQTGLDIPIRWRATIKVVGAQAQNIT